jgi:hypothetical protein
VGLTYELSGISAMLDDVWSDVGKPVCRGFSTSLLRNGNSFHTRRWSEVEGFQHSANTIDTHLELGIRSDRFLDFLETVNDSGVISSSEGISNFD